MENEAELSNKVYWTLADIIEYAGCGRTKASAIRQEAIKKFNGFNKLLPKKVKREAVLKVLDIRNK